MKSKGMDMTQGSALKLLTAFTLPSLAGNLLNQVYSLTDSVIVGRYLGETSLAAIGVCMPVILLTASMIIGLNIGVGILMSQCFGRRDIDQMRHTFANALYIAAAISVITALIGYPLTIPILKIMGTPAGPMAEAATYLHINFLTGICPMMYFLFSNAFRGMGDSLTALYCLIVSVVANIFLDILFVAILGFGVGGSAWATALAQGLSVVFSIIMLYRKYPAMHLHKNDFTVDKKLLRAISNLSVPIAIQSGFNNLGNIVVQSCINGFGETVMAAYTVASRLGTLSLMPSENVGSSVSVYAGQNYGAKRDDRIKRGVSAAWQINIVLCIALGALLVFGGKGMIRVFFENPGEETVAIAYRYLLIAAVPSILNGVMCIYQQTLRGIGKATESVIGGFMQLGMKVAVALAGAKLVLNLDVVWIAWPLSFLAGTIYPYFVYRKYMKRQVISEA